MSMSPPTAIIAEDEKALRDELRQRLSELWPELLVIGEAGTGIEALQLLEKHAPDLMFLDIQMPGMTGLEIAHQAQGRCHIVFVTAYDAYAVAAFETGALDYVLKPLERERLRLAVDRVSQRLGSTPQNLEGLLRELIRNAEPRKYLISSRSEEHTSELQSPCNLVCRLLLEKKKNNIHSLTDCT